MEQEYRRAPYFSHVFALVQAVLQVEPFEPNLGVLDLLFSQGSSAMTTITRPSRLPAVVG